MSKTTTIGILGAGKVGTALARRAIAAGCDVRLATARPAAEIELLVDLVAPGAKAVSAEELVNDSDIVILALPLSKYRDLRPEQFNGKIVIDAMNYWAPTDGVLPEFAGARSSTEVVAGYLKGARLVRAFNHIGYHEIDGDAREPGHVERRALAVAGDDPQARRIVAGLINDLGFDPVDAGSLATARAFDVGTPIFGAPLSHAAMYAALSLPKAA